MDVFSSARPTAFIMKEAAQYLSEAISNQTSGAGDLSDGGNNMAWPARSSLIMQFVEMSVLVGYCLVRLYKFALFPLNFCASVPVAMLGLGTSHCSPGLENVTWGNVSDRFLYTECCGSFIIPEAFLLESRKNPS